MQSVWMPENSSMLTMCSKQKSRKSVRKSSSSIFSLSMIFSVNRLTDEFSDWMAWSISSLSIACNSDSSLPLALVSPYKALLATR